MSLSHPGGLLYWRGGHLPKTCGGQFKINLDQFFPHLWQNWRKSLIFFLRLVFQGQQWQCWPCLWCLSRLSSPYSLAGWLSPWWSPSSLYSWAVHLYFSDILDWSLSCFYSFYLGKWISHTSVKLALLGFPKCWQKCLVISMTTSLSIDGLPEIDLFHFGWLPSYLVSFFVLFWWALRD